MRRRGASLLELLIVGILLMSVIGTVASFLTYMPHWAGVTSNKLNTMREEMAGAAILQGDLGRAGSCSCPTADTFKLVDSGNGDQWEYYLEPHPGGEPDRYELRASKDGKINYVRVAGLVKSLTCTTRPEYQGADVCLVYEVNGLRRREQIAYRRATVRAAEVAEVKNGDIDRDTLPDLITVRQRIGYARTYKGNLDATVTANVSLALNSSSEPRSTELVDFDGNGKLDAAVLTIKDVQILEADPSVANPPTFGNLVMNVTQTIALPNGAIPQTIAAGDLDADGATDLVASDSNNRCVYVMYGQTSNKLQFDAPIRWPTSPVELPGQPRRIRLVKMGNVDSVLDLVVGLGSPAVANSSVAVALGVGDRTTKFNAAVAYAAGSESLDLALGDINRDGILDMVNADWSKSRIGLALGTAPGALGAVTYTSTPSPTAVAFMEYDGQAPVDVAAVTRIKNTSSALHVFKGQSGGSLGAEIGTVNFAANEIDAYSIATTANVSPDFADAWAVAYLLPDPGGVRTGLSPNEMVPGSMVVRMADFNRDGKPDAVTVKPTFESWPRYKVQLYQGMAGATFNATGTIALATETAVPRGVSVGDFNRDGKIDFAVLTTKDIQVFTSSTPFSSQFAFSLTSTLALPSGAMPYDMAGADLDRDAKLDLIVSDFYNRCVYVYYGSGTGTFAADASGARWPSTDLAGQPRRLAVGDLNRDGMLDVVIGMVNPTTTDKSIAVGLGTASRSTKFSAAAGSPFTGGTGSWDVAIGDLDRNALPDIVSADWSGGRIALLKQQASGNLYGTTPAYTSTTNPSALRFVQWTSDAIPDVAVLSRVRGASPSSDITVYQGTSGGAIGSSAFSSAFDTATRADANSLAVGSVTHDGRDDFVAACMSASPGGIVGGNAPLVTTTGAATQSTVLTKDITHAVATGDFNRDGYPDLVTSKYGSNPKRAYVWLHNKATGASFFGTTPDVTLNAPAGNKIREIAVADFNRDGSPDIVCTSEDANALTLFSGDGAGAFANGVDTSTVTSTSNAPDGIAVGDFDRDGIPDVAVTLRTTNQFKVFNGQSGSSNFGTSYVAYSTGGTPNHIVAADLNQDGKLDVVTTNDGGDSITIAFGKGDGSFENLTTQACGTDPYFVDVGDTNADGILDIVVANKTKTGAETSGPVYVLRGTGNFTWPTAPDQKVFDGFINTGSGAGMSAVRLADVDRDGDLDLIACGFSGTPGTAISRVGIATYTGVSFAAAFDAGTVQAGDQPLDMVLMDLRRTGSVDFALSSSGDNSMGTFLGY